MAISAQEDETRRVFEMNDESNNAGLSMDEEMGSGELEMDIDIAELKARRRRRFSNKPDPRLRQCLWIIVPCLIFTALCAFAGLFLHWGGDAHPGARVRSRHPLSGGAEGAGLPPIIPAGNHTEPVLETSANSTSLNTTAVPVQPVAAPTL